MALLAGVVVVNFNPVAIRVLEIDLANTIYAQGYLLFVADPAFVGNGGLVELLYEGGYRRHTKTEVGIFIVDGATFRAADDMQMAAAAQAEPGMSPIVEGLRDGIQTYQVAIKSGAYLQIGHILGDMVEYGSLLLGMEGFTAYCGGNQQDGAEEEAVQMHSLMLKDYGQVR